MINENSFVQVPTYILFNQNLSIDAKIIYMALKWHCFGKQSCYPSIDILREECNMSIHKTKHGLKELYVKKIINKQRRGLGKTNIYYLYDNTENDYHEYLISPHWLKFKKEVLKHYGKKCSRCGDTKKLNVHHLNYECLGKETFNDVVVLCQSCHRKEHGLS